MLNSITVRDQIDTSSPRDLRHYKLCYNANPSLCHGQAVSASGSRIKLLRSIKECRDSSEAVCWAPTTFRWTDQDSVAYRFDSTDSLNAGSGGVEVGGSKVADVDGDGRADIVWFRRSDPACPGANRLRIGYGDRIESGSKRGASTR